MTKIRSATEFPKESKFMVIVFNTTSVYIPGDERSRTNPGHGYPEHTDIYSTPQLYAFTDRESLEAALKELYADNHLRQDILILKLDGTISVNYGMNINI